MQLATPTLLAWLTLIGHAPMPLADDPKAVIERAVNALGGPEAMASRAGHSRFKGKTTVGTETFDMDGETIESSDGRERMTFKTYVGGTKYEVEAVSAGDKSWTTINGALVNFENDALVNDQRAHQSKVLKLLPLLRDKDYTLSLLGESKVGGKDVIGIKVSYKDKPDISLFFDKTSGLLLKHAARLRQTGKETDALEETYFSDFRAANDLTLDEELLKEVKISTDGLELLTYLRSKTPNAELLATIDKLIKKLGDDAFAVREKATEELVRIGKPAIPRLQAVAKDDDLEVRSRANKCLTRIGEKLNTDATNAAVRLIAVKKPAGAVEALLEFAPFAEAATIPEIKAALVALATRDGKPNAALVKALKDENAIRRAVAEAVLGKDGGAYLKLPGRRIYSGDVKTARSIKSFTDGKPDTDLVIIEVKYVNAVDEKTFAKP